MKFVSTRKKSDPINFSQAIQQGLATDGGLYIPESFPQIDPSKVNDISDILAPFLKDDPLEKHLKDICQKAFSFPTPIKRLSDEISVLELFHGPTCAFKDVGARFLAECLDKIAQDDPSFQKTILVATSGDTGGAVASAFYKKSNFKVKILFPFQGVSQRQQQQLTCWGKNIESFAVKGHFDDCQKMVKSRLMETPQEYSSANSISIGRLLPQMSYYAMASLQTPGISFIVPSGNMGNVVAAFWAKKMGFSIDKIFIATNANKTISDFFANEKYEGKQTIKTLANAMDVGAPSNVERLISLYPDIQELKKISQVQSVSDEEIEQTIRDVYTHYNYVCCPHTATTFYFKQKLQGPWCLVSTAHPAKFETVIEPILNIKIDVPENLKKILDKESKFKVIEDIKEI